MVYYGEAMTAGKPLPAPYENIHDDVNQVDLFSNALTFIFMLCYISQALKQVR